MFTPPSALWRRVAVSLAAVVLIGLAPPASAATKRVSPASVKKGVAVYRLPALDRHLVKAAWIVDARRGKARLGARKVRFAAKQRRLRVRLSKLDWKRTASSRRKSRKRRKAARISAKGGKTSREQTRKGPGLKIKVKAPTVSVEAPPSPTESTTVSISFTVSNATSVTCALDGGVHAPCSSPVTYSGLQVGPHDVTVRASNSLYSTSATVSWEVVAPAPAPAPEPTPEPTPEPAPVSSETSTQDAGRVRFVKAAESDFDVFTKSPTEEQKAWMRAHYSRMRAYSPYFDTRLSWFPDAWFYQDLYAIYRTSSLATERPEWILKDAAGNNLYIPFGCSNGTCPQYAADFGNPAFRAWWIDQAKARMSKGYRGIFVDDVNMDWRIGDGTGKHVLPIDPRTGAQMTLADWRRYMAEMVEEIRAAFPDKEIVHNAIWYAGCGSTPETCWSDPYIRRELLAADIIELERGVNDSGITGGFGRWGYETFLARIDWLHSQGKSVVFDAKATTEAAREYGLASYFLVSSGRDGLGNDPNGTPADWWTGYDVSLGSPTSPRYLWNGVIRRDFTGGFVLVNQPGATTKTLSLGGTYLGPSGTSRTSVTLGAAQGAVLRNPS